MLNSSVHAASTAVSTTGRYSGLQPASTALMATFSTVHSTRSGGTTATTSSGARVVPASMRSTRAGVGAMTGQAVGPPRSNMASASSSSVGQLDAAAGSAPAPKRTASSSARAGSTDSDPHPGRQSGSAGAEVGGAGELLPLLARPADDPLDLVAAVDPDQRRHGLDVVVERHAEGPVVDDHARHRRQGTTGRPASRR